MSELVVTNGNALAVVEQAAQALAEVKTVEQADELWRKVKAVEEAARIAGVYEGAAVNLRRLQLRAKRRYGELLGESKPGAPVGSKNAAKNNVASVDVIPKRERDQRVKARKLAQVPEKAFERILALDSIEKITEAAILRETQRVARQAGRKGREDEKKERRNNSVPTGDWNLSLSNIEDFTPSEPVDAIVTDPPYPREFLHTWKSLGIFAAEYLKEGGSLLAMSGQSYLPEIFNALSSVEGLVYRWTLAYLTPGGQAVQLWDRHINTFWKPVLWFTKGSDHGRWAGDVIRSETNDNDKFFHRWGQSESGMADLLDRTTEPGQLVCDPFVGGGTTGLIACQMGRRFVGADSDESAIQTAEERLTSEFS